MHTNNMGITLLLLYSMPILESGNPGRLTRIALCSTSKVIPIGAIMFCVFLDTLKGQNYDSYNALLETSNRLIFLASKK